MSNDFAGEDDWERHRAFLAVLQGGSLSAAARMLALAQPTVRRRIAELEHRLGVALFTRAPDGLRPTDAALSLREPAEAMAIAAAAFARAAQNREGEVAGLVRISASDVIAIEVLPPILAELRRRHPALTIMLSPSNRNEDLLRREADIAVRMVRPAQDALVARRIGAIELGLHAHTDLLGGRPLPQTLDDVRAIGLIGVETDNAVLRGLRAQGIMFTPVDFAFRTDSDVAQFAAIRAGMGIGVCQVPLAAHYPALIRVLPDAFSIDLDTWVVMHEDLRTSTPVRAAFDALVAGLDAYLAQPSDAASIAVAAPRSA
ncbi:LysR family transcriptional regulator [Sphingomonas sp. So64.6b]|uniref:LysR family transcriptional regulator n=1 Tax=Sphingomonas sp. So64.6b TaxID=2997354 RepID=UPI001604936C|nr:LysR family transcriptional regulator [Sphingomonas sp. So64.6b]QNA85689.1 LysR family transcriptional regulator [Sphingomonas sp. So64.6b]